MPEPLFLSVEDVLYIHRREIERFGGEPILRDRAALEAAVAAPRATHAGGYLLDLFNMAATYVIAIAVRHPFLDGNKRAAAASGLAFLYLNGYDITERHDEEMADVVLGVLDKRVDREQLGRWFHERASERD